MGGIQAGSVGLFGVVGKLGKEQAMMVTVLVVLAAAFVFSLVVVAAGRAFGPRRMWAGAGSVTVLLGVATLFALVISSLTVVPAGHVGVPVLFGNVRDKSLGEGLHVVNPLVQVEMLSVRTQVYTMAGSYDEGDRRGDDSIVVLSKDGLQLPLDITVAYRLAPAEAPWVFQHFGPDYQEKFIRSSARTAIREAASQFLSQEAYAARRTELAEMAQQLLAQRIAALTQEVGGADRQAFVIQQVMLRNVLLPDRLRLAIEEKLAAEQEAQRMDFVLAKEEKEAQRKVIEAQGIAEFQQIVTAGISEQLLRWKGIEATMQIAESPNSKIVIVGGGGDGLPVILNTGRE